MRLLHATSTAQNATLLAGGSEWLDSNNSFDVELRFSLSAYGFHVSAAREFEAEALVERVGAGAAQGGRYDHTSGAALARPIFDGGYECSADAAAAGVFADHECRQQRARRVFDQRPDDLRGGYTEEAGVVGGDQRLAVVREQSGQPGGDRLGWRGVLELGEQHGHRGGVGLGGWMDEGHSVKIRDMAGGAVVAAAAAARALDGLLFAFRTADATAAERALPLRRIGIEASPMLAQLERAGVIKTGDDPATRYLDERALHAYQTTRRPRLFVALALAGAAMLFAIGMMMFFISRR